MQLAKSPLAPTDSSGGLPFSKSTNDTVASHGTKSVVNASGWSVLGYGLSQVLRLLNNMLLSYLLVPEAFGTMAIINIVIVGLGMFSEIGAGPCIVQNPKGEEPRFLDTAWTIQIARGLGIWLVTLVLAWPVATFYGQPELVYLIPVAAISSLINGFCSPSVFVMQRRLHLKSIAWMDIRSQLFGSIVMCSIAWISPTVWALVVGVIATALARSLLSHWLQQDYNARIRFDRQHAGELYHFGKWIFVSTLLAFGAMQIDRMMMGKLFDIRLLGIYGFGLAIASMPRMLVEKLSMSTLYPLLANSQRQSPERMSSELDRAREAILAVGLSLIVCVFIWCRLFFEMLYHDDYQYAGVICQWLCAVAWITMLSITLSRALIAIGDTRALAAFNIARLLGSTLASIVGFRIAGFEGFLIGLIIGAMAGHVTITLLLRRHSISVLGQDFRLSAVVILAGLSIHWLQSADIGLMQRNGIFIIASVGFLLWSAHEVYQYRFARGLGETSSQQFSQAMK